MTCAARIIPFSIHRCFFSLSQCTRRLINRQTALSFAVRAWSHSCNNYLSSRVVRSRFSAVSAFHTQSQITSDYNGWSSRLWPEWSSFLESLASAGYSSSTVDFPAADCVIGDFRMELIGLSSVCLAFARDHPTLLGMLSRSDIEVLVGTGTPHCFKNGDEAERRMQSYITSSANSIELATDKASLIDIMKYILSYTNDLCAPEARKGCNSALVESSLRNLLNELAKLSCAVLDSSLSGSVQSSFLERNDEQPPRTMKKFEMKRGDWICPRCNFMNFARNIRCLECEGVRPNGRLNSGEWDNFRSVSRNGDVNRSLNTGPVSSNFERKMTANDEKSQRWLNKVSELNNGSDVRYAVVDEDLPEIMPLRKRVNNFIMSTGKMPLERRLDNTQCQRILGTDGNSVNATLSRRISRSLDRVLSESPSSSELMQTPERLEKIGGRAHQSVGSQPSSLNPSWENSHENCVPDKNTQLASTLDNTRDRGQRSWSPRNTWENKTEHRLRSNGTGTTQHLNENSHTLPDSRLNNEYPNHWNSNIYGGDNLYSTEVDRNFASNGNSGVGSPGSDRFYHRSDSSSFSSNGGRANSCPPASTNKNWSSCTAGTRTQDVGTYSDNRCNQAITKEIDGSRNRSSPEGPCGPEPAALDMSEEAKAERWFKRVAEVKDISELSQIPDEDFPSIMPMRKGVNRFVVSKRKTPLERRLTSQQYLRTLPTVTSDEPLKALEQAVTDHYFTAQQTKVKNER